MAVSLAAKHSQSLEGLSSRRLRLPVQNGHCPQPCGSIPLTASNHLGKASITHLAAPGVPSTPPTVLAASHRSAPHQELPTFTQAKATLQSWAFSFCPKKAIGSENTSVWHVHAWLFRGSHPPGHAPETGPPHGGSAVQPHGLPILLTIRKGALCVK